MASHPDVTAYRLQLVYAEHRKDGKLKSELEKIVAAYPRFAPALTSLASLTGATGDLEQERELYRRASEAAPDNALPCLPLPFDIRRRMAPTEEYLRLIEEFLTRHQGEFAATVLHDAAENAETDADRQVWLERAANRPGTYDVDDLLALYARTDVRKAAELAQKKLAEAQKDSEAERVAEVKKRLDYYSALAHARDLLKAGQLDEARATLDKATPPEAEFHPEEFPKTTLIAEVLTARASRRTATSICSATAR